MKRPNVHRFLEGYGIRCHPIRRAKEPRPANVIYGGRTISRLLRGRGKEHTGLVLKCIQAANPASLYGDVVFAVSKVMRVHGDALGSRQDAVEAFRKLDLVGLRSRARELARNDREAMTNAIAALAIKIADEPLEGE